MFKSAYTFKIAGNSQSERLTNLKAHVDARVKLIERARNAKFGWLSKNEALAGDKEGYVDNPGGVECSYEGTNHMGSRFRCARAVAHIFVSTLNRTWIKRTRQNDWIPGDWGYIRNTSYSKEAFGDNQYSSTYEGQNLLHVKAVTSGQSGTDLFWGFHPSKNGRVQTAAVWFKAVENFNNQTNGAAWAGTVKFPRVGLRP